MISKGVKVKALSALFVSKITTTGKVGHYLVKYYKYRREGLDLAMVRPRIGGRGDFFYSMITARYPEVGVAENNCIHYY